MDEMKIFQWIRKIIETCENEFQLECAENLIELFNNRAEDKSYIDRLKVLRKEKFDFINGF